MLQQHQGRLLLILASAAVILLTVEIILSLPGIKRPDNLVKVSGDLDCYAAPQGWPIFANKVEGVAHPFFVSLQDFIAAVPVQDMLHSKPFVPLEVSRTIQSVLSTVVKGRDPSQAAMVDVGANVGQAAFAAAAMGFNVLAFEPVEENVQKLCDGLHLNRADDRVKIFHAAVSDSPGTTTLHKVMGRFDNTAVSSSGATANVKGEVVSFTVPTLTIDSVVPDDLHVALVKIDVQGWEYHVLKGAAKLLSRPAKEAPYLIYEEDSKLLSLSNTSAEQVLSLVHEYGYTECVSIQGDRHCSKLPKYYSSTCPEGFRLLDWWSGSSAMDDQDSGGNSHNQVEKKSLDDMLEQQLNAWRLNPEWVDEPPVTQVTVPRGTLAHLESTFKVGLPPVALFDIISDPNNKRVFKNIQEVKYRKILKDEGHRRLVEVEQSATWKFLCFSGTIDIRVFVEEDREACTMKYKLAKEGFMKRFEGSWVIEPVEDKNRVASFIRLNQEVQPVLVPPPPISWYIRGITTKTTEMMILDLQAEGQRVLRSMGPDHGAASTEQEEPGQLSGGTDCTEEQKTAWSPKKKNKGAAWMSERAQGSRWNLK